MKIALVGYGKMGHEIEQILLERGHSISFKINSNNHAQIHEINPENTDVAIEFTRPDLGFENVMTLLANQVKVVSGTTGWQDNLSAAQDSCRDNKCAMIWASNFSIGVNIFFKINKMVATMMQLYPDYTPSIEEIHHTAKKDAPSGTAVSLANDVIAAYPNLNTWSLEKKSDTNSLHIAAVRRDPEPGTHIITYSSDIDDISLSHVAKSRKGFAMGAVLAAEFLADKVGIFTMEEVLFS